MNVMVVEPRRERYVLMMARWKASSLARTALKLELFEYFNNCYPDKIITGLG